MMNVSPAVKVTLPRGAVNAFEASAVEAANKVIKADVSCIVKYCLIKIMTMCGRRTDSKLITAFSYSRRGDLEYIYI